MPVPPPSTWEPGQSYSYTRTRFVPVYPYVGDVEVRMGLYPYPGRGERPALKGEDRGFREYKVADAGAAAADREHLPGLQGGLAQPRDPSREPGHRADLDEEARRWSPSRTPRKDVVVYLEADTCVKCFTDPPGADGVGGEQRGRADPDRGAPGVPEEDPGERGGPRGRGVGGPAAGDERVVRAQAARPAAQQRRPRAGAERVPPVRGGSRHGRPGRGPGGRRAPRTVGAAAQP